MLPRISIIIPCYNAEQYIDTCFACLKKQTIGLSTLQIIFIDDCSTDHTWNFLKKLEADYPNEVIIIHNKENLRQGGAREIGLSYATAPYLAFLDVDDFIEDTMYQKLYDRITEFQCDFVMCRHDRRFWNQPAPKTDFQSDQSRLLIINSYEMRKAVILEGPFGGVIWNKLFDANYYKKANLHFPWHMAYEDNPFCCQVHLTVQSAYILEECLYHYMINDASTVLNRNQTYHLDILKANDLKWDIIQSYSDYSLFRHELNFEYMTTGYYGCMHTLLLRFDTVPYEAYLSLRQKILERVPDYNENPYVRNNVSETYSLLLALLPRPVPPALLGQVRENFCRILHYPLSS